MASPTFPIAVPLRRNLMLAVVLALITWTGLVACGGDAEAATEFTREPAGTPGGNPFMASVETSTPEALAATDASTTTTAGPTTSVARGAAPTPTVVPDTAAQITPPAGIHGSYTGSTPGLYGGTMNKASCNATQMVTFLKANPDKAAAWAGVFNIPTDQIETFVSRLTPMILRADTAVTNHGFRDGHATELRSVLQAGTAVLVNDQGEPVVKCGCGNPLTAPPTKSARSYTGPQWPAFTPNSVIEVTRTANPVNEFVLVHDAPADTPSTGTPETTGAAGSPSTAAPTGTDGDGSHTAFSRPVGTDGDADLPVTVPTGEGLTGDGSSDSSTTSAAGPGDGASTTTTTEATDTPDSTVPVATTDHYDTKLNPSAGDCLGTPGVTGTAEVVTSSTIHFTAPDASGPIGADGAFDILWTESPPSLSGGTATYHYHGIVRFGDLNGTLETKVVSPTGLNSDCTVTIRGRIHPGGAPSPTPTTPVTTIPPITIIPERSVDLPLPVERSWYFDLALASNGCEDITVIDGGRGRVRVYDDGHGFQSISFLGRPSINIGVAGGQFIDATVQYGQTVTLSGPTSGALPSIADDSPSAFTYTVAYSDPACTISFRATRTS